MEQNKKDAQEEKEKLEKDKKETENNSENKNNNLNPNLNFINNQNNQDETKPETTNNKPQNDSIDVSNIAGESSDFDDFCTKLNNKNIAFNQIDFSGRRPGFLDCLIASFSILFCRSKANFGFWDLVYLKAFYELIKPNRKELLKAQNEQNINWLSLLINKEQKPPTTNQNLNENSKYQNQI